MTSAPAGPTLQAFDFACLPKPGCIEVHPRKFNRRVAVVCNPREPWRKLEGQMQTLLYHVARSDKDLAGWLVCWVTAAGKSYRPGSGRHLCSQFTYSVIRVVPKEVEAHVARNLISMQLRPNIGTLLSVKIFSSL